MPRNCGQPHACLPAVCFLKGEKGEAGPGIPGLKGEDGNGIVEILDNSDGTITIVLTDGTTTIHQLGQDGADGQDGIKGQKGEPGINGLNGQNGINGTNGTDGTDGAKGQKGVPGQDAFGVKGQKGVPGEDAFGVKGQKGDKGDTGQKGVPGNDASGVKGQKGVPGEDAFGVKGQKGQKGDTGAKGVPGNDASGVKGQKGVPGNDAFGVKGQKGEKGDTGQKGVPGNDASGVKGQKGVPGNDASGVKGQKGVPGNDASGVKGQKGDTGQKGVPGEDASGVKGQKGEKGDTGANGVKGEKGAEGLAGGSGSRGICANATTWQNIVAPNLPGNGSAGQGTFRLVPVSSPSSYWGNTPFSNTHDLYISQDDFYGNDMQSWFDNINLFDIMVLRTTADPPTNVVYCLVLPIHDLNPNPPVGYLEPGSLSNLVPYVHYFDPTGFGYPSGYYQIKLHCFSHSGTITTTPFTLDELVNIGYSLNPLIKHDANSYTYKLVDQNIPNNFRYGEFYFTTNDPNSNPAPPTTLNSGSINYIVINTEAFTQHDVTSWSNRIKAGEIITIRELDYVNGVSKICAEFIYNGIRDTFPNANPSINGDCIYLPVSFIGTNAISFVSNKFYQISICGVPHESWNYKFLQQGSTPEDGQCSPVNSANPAPAPVITFGDITSIIFNNVDLDNLDCLPFFNVLINQSSPPNEYDLIMRKMHSSDYIIFNVSISTSGPLPNLSLIQVIPVFGQSLLIDYDAVYTCNITKKGLDGPQGIQGIQGIPGPPGADAENKMTEITFSRGLNDRNTGDNWLCWKQTNTAVPVLGINSPKFVWMGPLRITGGVLQQGHPDVNTMYALWHQRFDPSNPGGTPLSFNGIPFSVDEGTGASGPGQQGPKIGMSILNWSSVDAVQAQSDHGLMPYGTPSKGYNNFGGTNYLEPVAGWSNIDYTTPCHVAIANGKIVGYSINGIKNTFANAAGKSLAHAPVFCGVGRKKDDTTEPSFLNYQFELTGGLTTSGSRYIYTNPGDYDNIQEYGTEYFRYDYNDYPSEGIQKYNSYQVKFNKGDIIVAGIGPGFEYIGPSGTLQGPPQPQWSFKFCNGSFSISVFVEYEETTHFS